MSKTETLIAGSDGPLVSVVMSAYNEQRYIRAAVESILSQTYKNLEMVVVDDGSTDDTPTVLSQIQDPRLRVIRQRNSGQPAGLNAGITAARGDLITFLDGDDLCDPRRVESQAEYLLSHREVDGAGTWEVILDAEGRELDRTQLPCEPEVIAGEYALGRTGLNGMSVMAWARVLRSLGGFREPLYQANDVDMWMRATERYRFACVPEHLYWYRQHPRSSNVAQKEANRFYRNLVMELRAERLSTGTDRLARGETIPVPDFKEQSGREAYRKSIAFYHSKESRDRAAAGDWSGAVGSAMRGWWYVPTDPGRFVFLAKTLLGAVYPPARPHLNALRASWKALLPGSSGAAVENNGRMKLDPDAQPAYGSTVLHSTLVSEEAALQGLSAEWDRLVAESDTPTSFFMLSVCMLPFWRTYGSGRQLAVVAVRDGRGALVGIAPFYVESSGRGLLRHRRLVLIGSPESGADYLDVLCRPGLRSAVLEAALKCLEKHGVAFDGLNLNYILDDSPTLALLHELQIGRRFRTHVNPSSDCPYARLPATWEEFCNGLGASTRRGIKYQLNLVRRKFTGVSFEECKDEGQIPGIIAKLIEYKQARYGHRFDHDYLAWGEQAIAAHRAGHLRLLVLRLDGHPACIWFTFLFARRVFFQACAYDPDYASLRLGKVMMAHAIQSAIDEGAVEYDMKRGTTPYKYHWADAERKTVEFNLLRRTPRATWVYFWLYSVPGVGIRRAWRESCRALRRFGKTVLTPIARCWPGALPAPLRRPFVTPLPQTTEEEIAAVHST